MRTLYGYFRSSAAFRVRIALNLKGLAHEHAYINLRLNANEQKAPDFTAKNPQARIPLLDDDGFLLSQSPAIIEYLDEAYPEKPLLPADIYERAVVRQMCSLIACDIHPLNNLSVLEQLRGQFGADQAGVDAWYRHWITVGFTALEEIVARTEKATGRAGFTYGDSVTAADVYLVPQMWNAKRMEMDISVFPRLSAVYSACLALPEFQAASPEVQADNPDNIVG